MASCFFPQLLRPELFLLGERQGAMTPLATKKMLGLEFSKLPKGLQVKYNELVPAQNNKLLVWKKNFFFSL